MKVKITPEMRKHLTLDMMPEVRKIINDMKEITKESFMEDCQTAARIASRSNDHFEIIKAEAEIGINYSANGFFGTEYPDLDINLKIYAYNSYRGFYEIHVCLSDLWQLAGSTNAEEIRNSMYISDDEHRMQWKK